MYVWAFLKTTISPFIFELISNNKCEANFEDECVSVSKTEYYIACLSCFVKSYTPETIHLPQINNIWFRSTEFEIFMYPFKPSTSKEEFLKYMRSQSDCLLMF